MPINLMIKKNKEINKVVLLPLEDIVKNPSQPRRNFDETDLAELSRSIAVNGLLQPITARRLQGGKYELIAGERRMLAFKSLGRDVIPAIIEDLTDEQSSVMALIENLQRKDLNCFEEANGMARLMCELDLTQIQLSGTLGKAQSTIANKLRLLKYSQRVQDEFLRYNLTERHARALLKLQDEAIQLDAIAYIAEQNLNVGQTEEYIDRLLSEKEPGSPRRRVFIVKDMRLFLNSINKAVEMMNNAGICIDTQKKETGDFLEYTLRIPKASVYRTVGKASATPDA